ncbi:MAG: ChaN family lipoprotein [Gammaproteobacteria bacterium]|nr:ChaN family lipoprotein [Gammaproteobacteria bacterium]
MDPRTTKGGCAAGLLCLSISLAAAAGDELLRLEIGDPQRRGREAPVVLDAVTDTASGELITPQEMARRLAGTGILFIGENHTDEDFHEVQLRTIRALHEAGREVLIGVEMFPYTKQAELGHWIGGRYTESGFVELAGWYDSWGYNWNYYRDIFLYARAKGLRIFAINTPRETVKAVRAKGFTNLTAEEAAHLPPELAPPSDEHRRMYRAFFEADDTLHMNEEALDGLYRAQTMWDATMGWNALQALREHGGPGAIMVVLIGAGHVTYGLGSERQIDRWYEGEIASLLPVPVMDREGETTGAVRASIASFLWGLPPERAPRYPEIGISLMGALGSEPGQIIRVAGNSAGEQAGLRVGDILLEADGNDIRSEKTLNRVLAGHRWGDVVTLRIRRDGKDEQVAVALRRPGPAQKD